MDIDNNKKNRIIYIIMFSIIINPIIYGYYHTLLTEFVAITLSSITCYLAYLWLKIDVTKERKANISFTILFSFITIYSWFLKQPYISCGFFPFFVAYIIKIIEKRNIKNFIISTSSIIVCILCLFISIKAWDGCLKLMGNDPDSDRNPTNSLGNQLIDIVNYLKIDSNEYNSNNLHRGNESGRFLLLCMDDPSRQH